LVGQEGGEPKVHLRGRGTREADSKTKESARKRDVEYTGRIQDSRSTNQKRKVGEKRRKKR